MIIFEQALAKLLEQFLAHLSTNYSITVSRFYPSRLPQGVSFPAIVYRLGRDKPTQTHSGAGRLSEARVRFLIYANTYTEATKIRHILTEFLAAKKFELTWVQGAETVEFGISSVIVENSDSFVDKDTTIEIMWIDFTFRYWRNIAVPE